MDCNPLDEDGTLPFLAAACPFCPVSLRQLRYRYMALVFRSCQISRASWYSGILEAAGVRMLATILFTSAQAVLAAEVG